MSYLSPAGHDYADLAPRAAEAMFGREAREDAVEIETARRLAAFEKFQSDAKALMRSLSACEFIPGAYDAQDISGVLVDVIAANPVIVAQHIEASVRGEIP